ncbi:hypothetical protein H8N00_16270 [Streptomyces sp. AC563]|uniref:hypothetical protein n=1 Tax=Streptomyces buecherae TaxID=2763006 RepID=UPI00164DB275|nr:hypothetical protein [Streptomyces buecherae]MBC3990403.1 hypothetical protein [Streptomyces buecherae]
MPATSHATEPIEASLPVITCPHRKAEPKGPAMAEVLDLQEVDVPGTADALPHFFGDL